MYVKVVNAPDGLTYESKVLPAEGKVSEQSWISAEQWLTVPKADSIKCTATASYGNLYANTGLEEAMGSDPGDYVTLEEYYGKAYTSAARAYAVQTATEGTAKSINIYGSAKDKSGLYSVNTNLNGAPGANARFKGMGTLADARTSGIQVVQNEHIYGGFTSTVAMGSQTITRNPSYGSEYDLNAYAIKGTGAKAAVGYYVDPSMASGGTGAIQGAINDALAEDIINIAAGTYKENLLVDKSLTFTGAGSSKSTIDGDHAGSVITINPNVDASISGMSIINGQGVNGGGISNYGTSKVTNCIITGNSADFGAAIYNSGTVTLTSVTMTMNSATYSGGGLFNSGTATLTADTVSGNTAGTDGGGLFNSGPGALNVKGSTIRENSASNGGGIFSSGTATLAANTISKNDALFDGGGFYNSGTATLTTQTISQNNADNGGGVFNSGTATLKGNKITKNSAKTLGGGLFNSGTATLKADTLSENAATDGGGVYNTGTQTSSSDSISRNTAASRGGGVFNSGTASFATDTISSNTAGTSPSDGFGGGLYSSGATTVKGGSISKNQATALGGGIYWVGKKPNLVSKPSISLNYPDQIYPL